MAGYPLVPDAAPFIAAASNIPRGTNPAYTQAEFLQFYPQFDQNVPGFIIDQFIAMAHATVLEKRWHESWFLGMALFVAHFCTTCMQATGTQYEPTAAQVIAAAQSGGLQTSKSVGEVSVSYDFSMTASGLNGWAAWNSTAYGRQYATLARLLGKAGMYVW